MPRVAIYNESTDDLFSPSLGLNHIPGRSTVEVDLTDEQIESLKGHTLLTVTSIDGVQPTVEQLAPWTAPAPEVPPGFVASAAAASTPGGVAVVPVPGAPTVPGMPGGSPTPAEAEAAGSVGPAPAVDPTAVDPTAVERAEEADLQAHGFQVVPPAVAAPPAAAEPPAAQ